MPRAYLVAFCLAFIGAYGVLYAIHSSRATIFPLYSLESRIDDNESKVHDLEQDIEDIMSTIKNFEYRRY